MYFPSYVLTDSDSQSLHSEPRQQRRRIVRDARGGLSRRLFAARRARKPKSLPQLPVPTCLSRARPIRTTHLHSMALPHHWRSRVGAPHCHLRAHRTHLCRWKYPKHKNLPLHRHPRLTGARRLADRLLRRLPRSPIPVTPFARQGTPLGPLHAEQCAQYTSGLAEEGQRSDQDVRVQGLWSASASAFVRAGRHIQYKRVRNGFCCRSRSELKLKDLRDYAHSSWSSTASLPLQRIWQGSVFIPVLGLWRRPVHIIQYSGPSKAPRSATTESSSVQAGSISLADCQLPKYGRDLASAYRILSSTRDRFARTRRKFAEPVRPRPNMEYGHQT